MEVTQMWWLFLLGLVLGGTVGMVVMCLFQINKQRNFGAVMQKGITAPFLCTASETRKHEQLYVMGWRQEGTSGCHCRPT